MNTNDLRVKVREAVKNFGLTKDDVSISVKCSGYSDKIEIKAKKEIDFAGLQRKLNQFKNIDRDSTGEILLGGNTYVFIYHPTGYLKDWLRDC